ncbi:MAG: hypothetical protein LBR28_03990 [Bacteroidales bacterium]|nr:hypothetical protein [Bacteroidales bacterium]
MIELMEIMVDVFPQAVGVAVMKVKSFGLTVDAVGTVVLRKGIKFCTFCFFV